MMLISNRAPIEVIDQNRKSIIKPKPESDQKQVNLPKLKILKDEYNKDNIYQDMDKDIFSRNINHSNSVQ